MTSGGWKWGQEAPAAPGARHEMAHGVATSAGTSAGTPRGDRTQPLHLRLQEKHPPAEAGLASPWFIQLFHRHLAA